METTAAESDSTTYGSMGLKGLWAIIGNSTAMLVVSVVLFMALFQVQSMHKEGIQTLEKMMVMEREFNRASQEQMARVIEKNSVAISELSHEVKLLRHARESK